MMSLELTRLATGLRQRGEGDFEAGTAKSVSYPSGANQRCFELEEDSFWFWHRNAVLLHTVRTRPPPGLCLDVGGGNGFVTKALQDAGFSVALLEPGPDGIRHARARGVMTTLHATWEEAGFLPNTLGGVGLFDVLEHIADDAGFLASLGASLVPGGRLYLTVPAHPWLWSPEDVQSGHFRRYTQRGLIEETERAGFTSEWVTHFFSFLTVPIFLGRTLLSRIRPERDLMKQARAEHGPPNAWTQALVTRLCTRERERLASGRAQAFGSSLLWVGRKG